MERTTVDVVACIPFVPLSSILLPVTLTKLFVMRMPFPVCLEISLPSSSFTTELSA